MEKVIIVDKNNKRIGVEEKIKAIKKDLKISQNEIQKKF